MLYIAGGSDLASPWESAELTVNFAVGDAAGMLRGVVAFRMNDPPYRPLDEPRRNSAVLVVPTFAESSDSNWRSDMPTIKCPRGQLSTLAARTAMPVPAATPARVFFAPGSPWAN